MPVIIGPEDISLAMISGSLIPNASHGRALLEVNEILCAGPLPIFFITKFTTEGRVRSGSAYTMTNGSVEDLNTAKVTIAEATAINAMKIEIQSPVSISLSLKVSFSLDAMPQLPPPD